MRERLVADDTADRLAARVDRLRVVLARPFPQLHGESLFIVGPMAATLMDGKALAARIRAEVAREVAAFGRPIGLATVLVGDDPASDVYIRLKHKASLEVGIEARDLRLPATTTRAGAARARRRAERRRCGRRDPRPAAASGRPRREPGDQRDRSAEGRRRHPSVQRRAAARRHARARTRNAARRARAARRVRRRAAVARTRS